MKYVISISFFVLSLFTQPVFSQQVLLLKQPSLSADKLAFIYAGDIWVADRDGSNQGRDTQLEKAISEVLSQLEGFESPVPAQAPPLPTELGQ